MVADCFADCFASLPLLCTCVVCAPTFANSAASDGQTDRQKVASFSHLQDKMKSMKSAAAKRASKVFNNIKTLFIRSSTPKAGSKRGVPERDSSDSNSDDDSRDHKRRKLVAEFVASSSSSSSTSSSSSSSSFDTNPNYLSVTDYLQQIPSVVESIQELKSKPPVHLNKSDPRRIINVLQGEVAHATAEQADILVSDKATTCHILALRSTPIDCGGGGGDRDRQGPPTRKQQALTHCFHDRFSCLWRQARN